MGERIRTYGHSTFASLKVRNYRLFFAGQGISLSGTWMQTVALGWLVLQVSGSGAELGLVLALQYLPILAFAMFGGSLADRFEKRRILYITQSLAGLLALSLGALVYFHLITIFFIFVFALCLGLVNSVDNPTRQTFVFEMVGKDNLKNALTLNSIESNLARAVGPAVGGVIIIALGIAACFFINALSYAAVIIMLSRMRGDELHRAESRRGGGLAALKQGLQYVWGSPIIRSVLLMFAVVGTLSYEWQVSLPLFGNTTFDGGAGSYAALLGSMGVGSVVGGLFAAGRTTASAPMLVRNLLFFGASLAVVSLMPTLTLAILLMFVVGFFSIQVTSLSNTILQLESEPMMRGRVMSLFSMALLGSTPIGGPIIGAIGQYVNPRVGLIVGGIAAFVGAALLARALPAISRAKEISEEVELGTIEAEIEESIKQ